MDTSLALHERAPKLPVAMTTDETLMLEFQQGSHEAFTELFHRYREPVYGFFRRRLSDAARAEELAQEAFLAVLRGIARYEPRATFRSYLYGIAVNLVAAERRRQAHAPTPSAEPPERPTPGNPAEALCVRDAVTRLDPGEREILLLREYEGLSYAEISMVLRVPVNTVRSRLFRARLALRESLASRSDASSGDPS